MLQTTFFLISLVVGAFAITPALLDGIQDISTQVTKLDNDVTAFSSTNTFMDAFAIHKDVVKLVSTVDKATKFMNDAPKPISVDDAQTILAGVEAITPTISHGMDQLTTKNTVFKDKPIYSLFPGIPVLVKQDLNSVQGSASTLLETIISFVPADMVPQAKSIQGSINDAVARAVIAYS